jgi:hypothetical protein
MKAELGAGEVKQNPTSPSRNGFAGYNIIPAFSSNFYVERLSNAISANYHSVFSRT